MLGAFLVSGTGTDQNVITAYTGTATVATSNVTLTTTWQRFTITGTVATTATELAAYFSYTPSGTASTNDYYEITGVQLELGSSATTFSRNASTYQGELAACQRYYVQFGGDTAYQRLANGSYTNTTNLGCMLFLPVTMRVAPSTVTYGTLTTYDGNSFYSISSLTIDAAGKDTVQFNVVTATSTQFRFAQLLTNNSTSGYLGLSAEL